MGRERGGGGERITYISWRGKTVCNIKEREANANGERERKREEEKNTHAHTTPIAQSGWGAVLLSVCPFG